MRSAFHFICLLNASFRFNRFSLLKERLNEVSLRRKRTSLVLTKHPKLLEVLELPQLMETCVKNGHHEEALAIQQLCAKLHKPLGNVPLVR